MATPYCQSCGMPLAKDEKGGATLSDGTISAEYCSYCMEDGKFYYTGDDVKEYQKLVVNGMVKNGWSRPISWIFTRQIPRLKRWKK